MPLRLMTALGLMLILTGCGAFRSEAPREERALLGGEQTQPSGGGPSLHETIPAPSVPPELAGQARALTGSRAADSRKYSYTLDVQSPGAPELASTFEGASRLAMMINEPATMGTLEQRLAVSLEEGRNMLQSAGYYDGRIEGRLETRDSDKVVAVIRFTPGTRYKLGRNRVVLTAPLAKDSQAKAPPSTLAEVGLAEGSPAAAGDILSAVNLVEEAFRNRGYPRATVTNTRYTVDTAKKVLEAEIFVDPKGFARMGRVTPTEEISVDQRYLDSLMTWKVGQPWNQELLDNYLAALRQSGLFQAVEGSPAREDDADGLRPVRIRATGAPERTVGGLVSYDTDFGPGVTAFWEHRNFTGHGDRLRLDLPLWKDMQEFTAAYRYPFFLRPDQDIVAGGGFLHQDTDAYKLYSGAFSAGVERRLSRWWRVRAMGAVEGGSLQDPDQPKKEFLMFGLPVSATYDNANSLLDPTRGGRLIMLAAPYTGTFRQDFNVVRTRVEGQYFLPLGSDRLVLATRMAWGSLWGADNSQEVPSSLRFYSGGGGSVRGYDFQSVGPRNDDRDPLGGVSQVEVGAETRWRFSDTMGMVAFLDGGMVYENVDDRLFQDMLWGAGLGFRYYTAIGPVRVDAAVPLDKRPGDSSWQLYISIGQSF